MAFLSESRFPYTLDHLFTESPPRADCAEGMNEESQGVAPIFNRILQLTKHAVWNFLVNSIFFGSLVRRHVIGSKHDVPKWKEARIIRAMGLLLVDMVPMVKLWRLDEAMQWAEFPLHVGVKE